MPNVEECGEYKKRPFLQGHFLMKLKKVEIKKIFGLFNKPRLYYSFNTCDIFDKL